MADRVVPNPFIEVTRVVGNREPITGQLLDMDGAAINLTGKTIHFRMVRIPSGNVVVAGATATIDDAATGKVSYTPSAAEVQTKGDYALYFVDATATPNKWFPIDGAKYVLHLIAETEH